MPSNELTWMERNNITPAKAGAVGVLAIVFVGVFIYQLGPIFFRGSSAPVAQAKKKSSNNERRSREVKKAEGSEPAKSAPKAAKKTNWPDIALQEVIDYDPFRLPASMRQALLSQAPVVAETTEVEKIDESKRRREQLITQMSERGVDVVIFDGSNAVASIGDIELRVGDVIEGLLVRSINRDGVELVEVDPDDYEQEDARRESETEDESPAANRGEQIDDEPVRPNDEDSR